MPTTGNHITDTAEIEESQWDGNGEPNEVQSDLVATREPEGRGIEFNVSMRDYTLRDMEGLIVEAAARVLVGEYGNNKLAKLIDERCMALTVEKIDKRLATVTAEIIDQPLTPKYSFTKADEKPVTMREFIALTGQAYLTAYVNSSGNPASGYDGKPRIQHLVDAHMQRAFKNEIEKATNAAIVEIRKGVEAQHQEFLAKERARFRDALSKTVAG